MSETIGFSLHDLQVLKPTSLSLLVSCSLLSSLQSFSSSIFTKTSVPKMSLKETCSTHLSKDVLVLNFVAHSTAYHREKSTALLVPVLSSVMRWSLRILNYLPSRVTSLHRGTKIFAIARSSHLFPGVWWLMIATPSFRIWTCTLLCLKWDLGL